MSRQILIKSMKMDEIQLTPMYEEAQKYLEAIGFKNNPMLSVTSSDVTFRSFLFAQGNEKILVEYKKDMFEEVLKLVFEPLRIKFVYDILLMRFNQLSMENKESIFIYND